MTKLKVLRWKMILTYPRGADVITKCLCKGKMEAGERWHHEKDSTIAGFKDGRGCGSRNALEASRSWK